MVLALDTPCGTLQLTCAATTQRFLVLRMTRTELLSARRSALFARRRVRQPVFLRRSAHTNSRQKQWRDHIYPPKPFSGVGGTISYLSFN